MKDSILVVDDHEKILDFLFEILNEDYDLHLATSAEEAQVILANEMVHLVISDIMMPGIDGFELCQQIKTNSALCHIPVILLTVKDSYRSHVEGLEVGADAYIQKPFSTELLRLQIANLLKNRTNLRTHLANNPFKDPKIVAHSRLDEIFLKKLDDYIQQRLDDIQLDIDQLAEHMNMSRSSLYRRVKSLCFVSPRELIETERLKKATSLLEQNQYSMFEIARMVGYSSQSIFARNFLKQYKLTPTEYFKNSSSH